MKYGVIDIGSNSVRLMVAEDGIDALRPIYVTSRTTRLIHGMKGAVLAADAIERTVEAIRGLAREAAEHGAERVEAFATSAVRDAENREAFYETGVKLRVMSGDEEAALAYAGALDRYEGKQGVLDIGGGSTEVLCGVDGKVRFSKSVPIGAVRLYDRMAGSSKDEQLAAASEALADACRGADPEADYIGVGGTVHNFAAIDIGERNFEKMHGWVLTAQRIEAIEQQLTSLPLAERKMIPGIEAHRADILPMGGAILTAFMRLTGLKKITSGMNDNLQGYIEMYMKQ